MLRSSLRLSTRALLHPRRLARCRSIASAAGGGALLYRDLALTFRQIERVKQSRDASVRLLAARFRDALQRRSSSSELASALYLTASQLAPPHEGVELRFGTRLFAPVIAQFVTPDSERSTAALDVNKFPDFGTAVQALIDSGSIAIPGDASGADTTKPQGGMTVAFVHQELLRLAREGGSGAVTRKQQRAVELLQQCRSAEEMVFLVRMLAHQSLRIGMGEKSILAALAIASAPSPLAAAAQLEGDSSAIADTVGVDEPDSLKRWIESVTKAYAQQPNYAALATLLLENTQEQELARKVEWLDARAAPTVGIPVLTMSAYPVASVSGVVDRIRKSAGRTATCEYKYDGARVQIHLSTRASASDEEPVVGRIFSRNMEDNTEKYGSLLPVLHRQLRRDRLSGDGELIVEGEVVAVDRATQRFLPFQVLQTKATTDFCLFVFDLLHLNGEKLIHRSLRERRGLLRTHLVEDRGHLEFVRSIDIEVGDADTDETASSAPDASRVREFLQDAVAAGCEGLMVKTLDGAADSDYKAGARSYSWMKVKQDYLSEDPSSQSERSSASRASDRRSSEHGTFLPDTLDLVPIGAFYGKGRRSGVFGSFLLAAYDAASGKFETIGKVGTGFSDAQLTEISERLRQQQPLQADGSVPTNISSAAIRSRHPDVWLSPSEVWEIKATQLTASPSYMCASQPVTESEAVESDTAKARGRSDAVRSKGLALRFPRFVRFRADKHPEQATDSAQVAEFFRQQTASQNGE